VHDEACRLTPVLRPRETGWPLLGDPATCPHGTDPSTDGVLHADRGPAPPAGRRRPRPP
jgi:hypothetical protein